MPNAIAIYAGDHRLTIPEGFYAYTGSDLSAQARAAVRYARKDDGIAWALSTFRIMLPKAGTGREAFLSVEMIHPQTGAVRFWNVAI